MMNVSDRDELKKIAGLFFGLVHLGKGPNRGNESDFPLLRGE